MTPLSSLKILSVILNPAWRALDAALLGAREVGFTVLSMSTSLVAVFIPILLMGGIVGRLFAEFAITLSIAVMVSLIVSLDHDADDVRQDPASASRPTAHAGRVRAHCRAGVPGDAEFLRANAGLSPCATLCLTALVLLATIALNIFLYIVISEGLLPATGHGSANRRHSGGPGDLFPIDASRNSSQLVNIVRKDPGVAFGGGFHRRLFDQWRFRLRVAEAAVAAHRIGRPDHRSAAPVRPPSVAGGRLFFQSVQDIRVGGRQSNAQYQYTLQADDLATLQDWSPQILEALQKMPDAAGRQYRPAG